MSKYEVWAKDQYNRHEILSVLNEKGRPENQWDTPAAALAAARRYAHDKNRNNSLTFDEQQKNPTHVVAEVAGGDAYYAGNLIHGKHKMLKVAGEKVDEVVFDAKAALQFYLGQDESNKPWFLKNQRRQPVTSLDDYLVTERTILFVHKQ
jgi:hypothetical protein